MTYLTLKAGDIRQEGDETRQVTYKSPWANHDMVEFSCTSRRKLEPWYYVWIKVSLLTWPILKSDLIAAEFRRPLP